MKVPPGRQFDDLIRLPRDRTMDGYHYPPTYQTAPSPSSGGYINDGYGHNSSDDYSTHSPYYKSSVLVGAGGQELSTGTGSGQRPSHRHPQSQQRLPRSHDNQAFQHDYPTAAQSTNWIDGGSGNAYPGTTHTPDDYNYRGTDDYRNGQPRHSPSQRKPARQATIEEEEEESKKRKRTIVTVVLVILFLLIAAAAVVLVLYFLFPHLLGKYN